MLAYVGRQLKTFELRVCVSSWVRGVAGSRLLSFLPSPPLADTKALI